MKLFIHKFARRKWLASRLGSRASYFWFRLYKATWPYDFPWPLP